jgi:hypothetical protein
MPDSTDDASKIVRAAPTKRFFISVLIKDIYLIDAVIELVDNSVDSARSTFGVDKLKGRYIEIKYNEQEFSIKDNAAGISVYQAQHYAFRFGRPEDAPPVPGAIGEFGVGMKRALFKIGRYFEVASDTSTDHFVIRQDVDEWEAIKDEDPNSWNFKFAEVGENADPNNTGTTVLVRKLHQYAIEEFASTNFASRLVKDLKESHAESLAAGLQITVNNISVEAVGATLLASDGLKPIHKNLSLNIAGKEITAHMVAGLGEPKLLDAGWYIYCNGRLIERAEKTEKTGWNSALDGGDKTPRPHWQFRRFRGYLFFESKSPDVLPWNTTKTGLDTDAPAYRQVKSEMTSALSQVIAFLNELDSESTEPGPLTALVDGAAPKGLDELQDSPNFVYDAALAGQPSAKEVRISYTRPPEIFDRVKSRLSVRSKREVGERTFDYYVESEGLNE